MIEPNVIDFSSPYLKIKCNKTKEIFSIKDFLSIHNLTLIELKEMFKHHNCTYKNAYYHLCTPELRKNNNFTYWKKIDTYHKDQFTPISQFHGLHELHQAKCNICGNILNKNIKDFVVHGCNYCNEKLKEQHVLQNNRQNFLNHIKNKQITVNIEQYFTHESIMDIKCNICSHEWKDDARSLYINEFSCPYCRKEHSFVSKEQFINRINEFYDNVKIINFTRLENEVIYKCTKCNKIHKLPSSHALYHGMIMPCYHEKKKLSLGETIIYHYLKDNGYYFDDEFTFDDCKFINKLKFDFVVFNPITRDIQLLIECDGSIHNTTQKDDIEKRRIKIDYCKMHNYNLFILDIKDIRGKDHYYVNLKKHISQILKEKLQKIPTHNDTSHVYSNICLLKKYDFNEQNIKFLYEHKNELVIENNSLIKCNAKAKIIDIIDVLYTGISWQHTVLKKASQGTFSCLKNKKLKNYLLQLQTINYQIFILKCKNRIAYVGFTLNSQYDKLYNYRNIKLRNFLKKYKNEYVYSIIDHAKSKQEAILKENFWIEFFASNKQFINEQLTIDYIKQNKILNKDGRYSEIFKNNFLSFKTPTIKKAYSLSGETKQKISKKVSGERNPAAVKIKCVETNEIFGCIKSASIKYDIPYGQLLRHLNNKKDNVKNLHFQYM